MTNRTSTVYRTLSLLAAVGRGGKLTLKEAAGDEYMPDAFQHDAARLYEFLRTTLPSGTWDALRARVLLRDKET